MNEFNERSFAEKDLAKALSRHIGYTTGAYHLDRIFSVLEIFSNTPSAYINELVQHTKHCDADVGKDEGPSDEYLIEVPNFAESMSLIQTVSQKGASLRRLAPTEIGRALLGARCTNNQEFLNFFFTKAVMLADADAIFPILDYFSNPSDVSIQEHYRLYNSNLRMARAEWIVRAIPEPRLLKRVVDYVPWLSLSRAGPNKLKFEVLSLKTAKHHMAPRQGWLYKLNILDTHEQKKLTRFGLSIYSVLTQYGKYFWLGPHKTSQEVLRIPQGVRKPGPFHDTIDLGVATTQPSIRDVSDLAEDTVEIMKSGYKGSKLIHADQATLLLPIEYIKFRKFFDKKEYEWEEVISHIFKRFRSEFERLSPKKGKIGFYKWRKSIL